MQNLHRRDLLKALPAIPAIGWLSATSAAEAATVTRSLGGPTLAGWEVVLGDALYAAPGVAAVSLSDIRTVHYTDRSELLANVARRRIMAHNITFKRVLDTTAMQRLHSVAYSFRLPFLPVKDNFDRNAQTIEGGVFVWDGSRTRLDHGVAFQWMLNPWMAEFGEIRAWTDWGGGQWQKVGYLKPDTNWHRVSMVLDPVTSTTNMILDGKYLPSAYSRTPRPSSWGTETAARLQAEIVSLYPGPTGRGALHQAAFNNWSWTWTAR